MEHNIGKRGTGQAGKKKQGKERLGVPGSILEIKGNINQTEKTSFEWLPDGMTQSHVENHMGEFKRF